MNLKLLISIGLSATAVAFSSLAGPVAWNVSIGGVGGTVGFGVQVASPAPPPPPVVVAPAPVVIAPPPVVVAPAPVYVTPPPVVIGQPVYWAPPAYYAPVPVVVPGPRYVAVAPCAPRPYFGRAHFHRPRW